MSREVEGLNRHLLRARYAMDRAHALGRFSRTSREIVGETPSAYRDGHGPMVAPNCVQMSAMRPRVAARATNLEESGAIEQVWRSRRGAGSLA